ncbi:hypothetical protein BU16DRAFT_465047 [Lophium mytilinum]|uniref:DnaJ homologue subfamily C member 28 conserved domain-containing protein n=1 Tax=Lophium mytilinum TaxID=390894 RepID=A0A6A6QMT4_9PEZI|nr:hypothetical protein BU16DRAFT_465047 [Lophium mytilinum]
MSEESLETGGRSAQKAVEESGFDESLRRKLEERIASANFKNEYASAFAEAGLPSSAGRSTRDIAAAQAWTGTESVEDASLRMLTDSYKPMRVKTRIPSPATQPPKRVDTGRPGHRSTGARLANARDKTSIYATLKDSGLSEKEKEKMRQDMKDRFAPHARAVPATIQGLASLANERIEDAIARGQFKNLPNRGKQIERDYNASSPFLDTTEYFMNKIIQKQEIVPPWIEKQQELVSTATKFRARLRNDWKRHAARMIASRGGTLQEQVRRAQAYAAAELIVNPPRRKEEKLNSVDDAGHFSQISLSGELSVPSTSASSVTQPVTEIVITETKTPQAVAAESPESVTSDQPSTQDPIPPIATSQSPPPIPFRDPTWLATENAFLTLSITSLNALTRTYNLMAPDLAKKPYFSLPRELAACYSDVAPQIANAIVERAAAPKRPTDDGFGFGKGAGMVERLTGGGVRVKDERPGRAYGFKEFWRDVWGKEGSG